MKFAIIFGVIHMMIAFFNEGLNYLYFKKFFDFFFIFLTKITFMMSIFGYMVFCIIYKWNQDFSKDTSKSPSIINLFINFTNLPKDSLFNDSKY